MANRAQPATEAVTETMSEAEVTEAPVIIESVQGNLNKQPAAAPSTTQQATAKQTPPATETQPAATQQATTTQPPATQPTTPQAAYNQLHHRQKHLS